MGGEVRVGVGWGWGGGGSVDCLFKDCAGSAGVLFGAR